MGGILVSYASTSGYHKKIFREKYPYYLFRIAYMWFFLFRRVIPKISPLTHQLLKRSNKVGVYTYPEILGRLVYNGFKITEYKYKDGFLFFVVMKVSEIHQSGIPSNWLIFPMTRVGKNGKDSKYYKLRTMHPYAEFLQNYIRNENGIDEGGKFKDDFRISRWGRWLRKYWIDELPMLINLIKGDIKLVGVRPISRKYLEMYPQHLQLLRINSKPGLIPAFYADLPRTLEEIFISEEKYLIQYKKHPFICDLYYLSKAIFNILFKKVRSK